MRAQTDQWTVELVYDRDCPNVDQARERISAALREVGAPTNWMLFDRDAMWKGDTPPKPAWWSIS